MILPSGCTTTALTGLAGSAVLGFVACALGPVTRPPLPKVVSRAPALSKQRSSSASSRGRNALRLAWADGIQAWCADKNHMGNLLLVAVRVIMRCGYQRADRALSLFGPVSPLLGGESSPAGLFFQGSRRNWMPSTGRPSLVTKWRLPWGPGPP